MNAQPQTTTAVTAVDGFDIAAADPSASPSIGADKHFVDGEYFDRKDKLDVRGRSYVVLNRREGWQFLKRGCPPEFLMRAAGEPKPPQPHVPEAEWPLNLNGVPAHPWKYTYFLYLLDVATGEFSTFWSNTTGGRIAIGELSDQIASMRRLRPGARPVVQLRSKAMPTKHGGVKPRPYFLLAGWKDGEAMEQAQIAGPTAGGAGAVEPAQRAGPEPAKEAPAAKAATATKRGVLHINKPRAVEEPTLAEVLDDEIPF